MQIKRRIRWLILILLCGVVLHSPMLVRASSVDNDLYQQVKHYNDYHRTAPVKLVIDKHAHAHNVQRTAQARFNQLKNRDHYLLVYFQDRPFRYQLVMGPMFAQQLPNPRHDPLVNAKMNDALNHQHRQRFVQLLLPRLAQFVPKTMPPVVKHQPVHKTTQPSATPGTHRPGPNKESLMNGVFMLAGILGALVLIAWLGWRRHRFVWDKVRVLQRQNRQLKAQLDQSQHPKTTTTVRPVITLQNRK